MTPKDIIEKFSDQKVKDKVARLNRNQLVGLACGVASYARDFGKKEDRPKMMHVLDFIKYFAGAADKDLAIMLGRAICHEMDNLSAAVFTNAKLSILASKYKRGKLSWVSMIAERPDLQEIMAANSYGAE